MKICRWGILSPSVDLKKLLDGIFTYDSWPIPRPKKLATSLVFHGRWIGHTNGSDRPSNKHFSKRSFHLAKIKPSVHGFLHMTPKLSEKICFHSMIFKKVLELHNNLLRSPIIHGFLQISPLTFRKYACSP
jgi:hypothetical protein